MRFLVWLLTHALALAVAAQLLDGIYFEGPTSGRDEFTEKILPLLGVALILGVINAIVKPVLTLLSLPFVILTLGLFVVVINALLLRLTSWFADGLGIGFHVTSFWTAVGGALIISISTWAIDRVLDNR